MPEIIEMSGTQVIEDPDRITLMQESFHQMGTDEASAARDKDDVVHAQSFRGPAG
jgi:hypothetical protein